MAESFFAALKNELCNRTVYPTRAAAMKDTQRSARRLPIRPNGRIAKTESLSKKLRADHTVIVGSSFVVAVASSSAQRGRSWEPV